MKNTFKKIQNRYLSPYANRNFEVLAEWENLVEIAKKYGDSGYAIQQARIPSSFLAKRLLQLNISEGELAQRRANWQAPNPRYTKGILGKYAKLVSSSSLGAVTDLDLF